jgi:hypothetical protein
MHPFLPSDQPDIHFSQLDIEPLRLNLDLEREIRSYAQS